MMVQGWIVLVGSVVAVLADLDQTLLPTETKELMVALHKNCVDHLGVTEAQVNQLKAGVFTEDVKLKCYTRCLMSESGVMDENGAIDIKAFSEILPESIRGTTRNVFDSCAQTNKDIADECVKAYEVIQCWYKQNPESYFMI
uniref:Odorant binding protein 8 n=1 Tax=Tomicus yunnanensis TaxID=768153 RepID=A0A4P2HMC9_9CUCU|nr:odorant binding protein 8 [Tomicus yunnanensis]